jgi:peptidoglycan-associated lipoprotein
MRKTFTPFRISEALIKLSVSLHFLIIAIITPVIAQQGSPSIPPPIVEEELQLKDIFFDFTSNNIRSDAEYVLRENAETLKKNPKTTVLIEGYSDTRGVETYNMRLGQTRADAAKAYLVELGIDPKRIKTVAKGATIKFSSEGTEEAFQLNRRSHFILEPALTPKSPESLSTTTDEPRQSTPQALLTPEELSKALEDELKKLAPKQIIFNPSREMKAGVSQRVGVRISKTLIEDLDTSLKKKRIPKIDKIDLGEPMKIDLTGNNFNITPISQEEQTTAQHEFTDWGWDVTPLKTGTQSLLLSATVRTDSPDLGTESKNYPLYIKAVKVKFNPAYSTINFIKSYWLWIVGIIIVSGMVRWAVKR